LCGLHSPLTRLVRSSNKSRPAPQHVNIMTLL
jgi:hypothetical protein